MERKLMRQLIAWKDSQNRKPLILEGARQVGKTYLLEDFAKRYFNNYVRIDFQRAANELNEVLDRTLNPMEIIRTLEGLYNLTIDPKNTLIFFDEVQDSPRALTALKYFCEEAPAYHIVVAGSLLGVSLRRSEQTPFPVGKVDRLRLEPMDFQEFLTAAGRPDLAERVAQRPEDPIFDQILKDYLRDYMLIGGMPAAVKEWLQFHDYNQLEGVHSKILADYRQDFSKYTDATTATRISQIFETLPKQFAKHNDKFLYGIVREGARGREYEIAVEWLVNAGIIRRVRRIDRGDKMPLRAYADTQAFKLYFLDIGLFRQLANIPPRVIFEKDGIFNEYNGFFAEQFVLQNLSSRELFYWTGRSAEVDFVFQDNEHIRIVPIEVKSGENVKAKSLRSFRDRFDPPLSLRLSLKPFQYSDGLLNLPLYKIFGFDRFLEKY